MRDTEKGCENNIFLTRILCVYLLLQKKKIQVCITVTSLSLNPNETITVYCIDKITILHAVFFSPPKVILSAFFSHRQLGREN